MEASRCSQVRPLLASLVVVALAACGDAEPASVQIVEPADGGVLTDGNVRVVLQAYGVEIAPASRRAEGDGAPSSLRRS